MSVNRKKPGGRNVKLDLTPQPGTSSQQQPDALSPTSKAQEELDIAYYDYLLAAAANHLLDVAEATRITEIEIQLGFLKEKLIPEQKSLKRAEDRLQDITRLHQQSSLLDKLEASLTTDLASTKQILSSLVPMSDCFESKMQHLNVKNARIADEQQGIADLRQALSETLAMGQDNSAGPHKMADTVARLKDTRATLVDVCVKQAKMVTNMPKLQMLQVREAVIQGIETTLDNTTFCGGGGLKK